MIKPKYESTWTESWKYSYPFDLMEVYGEVDNKLLGYYYAYKARQEATLAMFKKFVPVGSKVIDLAAGQGNFSLLLAEMGYSVTWNDLRDDLQGYVELKYEKGDLKFLPGNCFDIVAPNSYDVVLITEIIEHVAHPDDFLKSVAALVKPNGIIIMTTPNGEYFYNSLPRFSDCPHPEDFEVVQFKPDSDGHIFLLYKDEILSLGKKAGLTVEYLKSQVNPLTSGHFKLHFLLRFLPRKFVALFEQLTTRLPEMAQKSIHTNWVCVYRKAV